MAKNKNEQKGEDLRRQGEPKPHRKREGLITTKAEVRARDDQRIGWERENTRRTKQANK